MATSNALNTLLNMINAALFEPQERRLTKIRDRLHRTNEEILKRKLDGFMYEGQFYRHSTAAVGPGLRVTLDLSLWSEMQEYLKDARKVDSDKSTIKQCLYILLDRCYSAHDLRDATPDCIIDIMPDDIRLLGRVRDCDSFLVHPRDHKLYQKTLPLMEFYAATRLIY